MSEHSLFVVNVLSHLVALMSGIVSFGLALWAEIKKKPHHRLAFWIIGCLCLIVAFDQAWRDEHHNTKAVIDQKADLTSRMSECSVGFKAAGDKATFFEEQTHSNQQTINQQLKTLTAQQQTANSQQNTMNNCVVALGKANIADPQKTSVGFFSADFQGAPLSKHKSLLLAFTNKPVPSPARGRVACTKPFKYAQLGTVGSGMLGIIPRINEFTYDWELSSPQWTPTNPLIFVIAYDEDDLGPCGIQLR
jgi:hypothetical protein